ncbi:hypothetical protein J4E83_002577 [Alternaria metachromatica]|uniref:uncharacterized protein n=1 Tax=Alternaria metachromatica TaxID=283354 RepID=UPI0020C23448|nr:uncharacterized protein J4E83_002577 [Alternaria metachromatica]KAI4631049.1 hypothetical protein J4E83_002577 [Alternaria metachromatica]
MVTHQGRNLVLVPPVQNFLLSDSWSAEMTYLAENGIPAIGDKEFDALGYNGVISAKSLYWLSRKREEDDEWTIAKNRMGTNGFPHLAFHVDNSGRNPKDVFDGAHDPVNDAAMTLLNAIGCAIEHAAYEGILDRDGKPMSWDSTPPVTPTSPWHIAAVDAEGANVPRKTVLSEWGTKVIDKRWANVHNPFCPRPRARFLWFDKQTVIKKLDTKEIGGAILGDLSATGYTRRHFHLWPANERVAETAAALCAGANSV